MGVSKASVFWQCESQKVYREWESKSTIKTSEVAAFQSEPTFVRTSGFGRKQELSGGLEHVRKVLFQATKPIKFSNFSGTVNIYRIGMFPLIGKWCSLNTLMY